MPIFLLYLFGFRFSLAKKDLRRKIIHNINRVAFSSKSKKKDKSSSSAFSSVLFSLLLALYSLAITRCTALPGLVTPTDFGTGSEKFEHMGRYGLILHFIVCNFF